MGQKEGEKGRIVKFKKNLIIDQKRNENKEKYV